MMKKKTTKINENISISKLLEQGNLALNKAQPELALKFFEKAYNLNQNNTEILENLIEVLLQLNENEKAYSYLCHSIEIEPLKNPCKYLYIAQLQQGKISLESYKKGISLLIQEKNENNVENTSQIDKQLSKAYCGVAELYLTDLCFEENAEQECENAVNAALSHNNSLDAQHLQASLRISQNRMSEACDIVENIFQAIKQNRAALAQRTIIEELAAPTEPNPDSSPEEDEIYSEELCITTAKMLIECSVLRPNLSRLAVELLTSLLEEDDENIQLWFLAGVAEMGPEDHPEVADLDAATYYLNHAKEMIEQLVNNHQATMTDFQEEYGLITHHLRLIEQIVATTSSSGNQGDEESKQQHNQLQLQQGGGNNQEEEEEEWSTEEEDDDDEDNDNMELSK